jgi:hypothetical protein
MTGYKSKRAAAQGQINTYGNPMSIYEMQKRSMAQPNRGSVGVQEAQPAQERNFCSRCGKRTADLTVIHTCTPPQETVLEKI